MTFAKVILGAGAHWPAAPCWFKCWCCKFWTRVHIGISLHRAVGWAILGPYSAIVEAMLGYVGVLATTLLPKLLAPLLAPIFGWATSWSFVGAILGETWLDALAHLKLCG